jgi:hypothetical protein
MNDDPAIIRQRQLQSVMAVNSALDWMRAISVQAKRVLARERRAERAWQKMRADAGARLPLRRRRVRPREGITPELHFFVIAVWIGLEWAKRAMRFAPELKPAVRAFVAAMPHLDDMRDLMLHLPEYHKGGGKHREKLFTPGPIQMDPTSVLGRPEGPYLIGGRIDLHVAVKHAQGLVGPLRRAEARLMDEFLPEGARRMHREMEALRRRFQRQLRKAGTNAPPNEGAPGG